MGVWNRKSSLSSTSCRTLPLALGAFLFDGAWRFLTQEEAKKPRYFLRKVGEVQELFRLDLGGGEA